MARVNAGDPTAGLNYELTAITAAIIGGTNLFGGRGSVLGTFIGALIMGVLQNGLNLLAVQSYYQQMAIGAVLILAVWLDRINAQRLQRALMSLLGPRRRAEALRPRRGAARRHLRDRGGLRGGLVGDNGAGKSTLMKCITGIYRADTGSISFDGAAIDGLEPGAIRGRGIEMIYQDLALAPQQDVASNIFLGREPTRASWGSRSARSTAPASSARRRA